MSSGAPMAASAAARPIRPLPPQLEPAKPPRVERLDVTVCRVPTDEQPESDATLKWSGTTLVVAEARAGGLCGIGYSYTSSGAATVIDSKLRSLVIGADALSPPKAWWNMIRAVRNVGRSGIAAGAISAVDTALWDLKARLLSLPLAQLLGQVHEHLEMYGSGGFTSYEQDVLDQQLASWVDRGFRRVKMKVGREPERDLERVAAARRAIGPDAELMVDANGAFTPKQAVCFAEGFATQGVTWFEEPVSSDDRPGLRFVRERCPATVQVTAGEYGFDVFDLHRLLADGAVDILQADVTRCLGITGLMQVAALCNAFHTPLSLHTAPALHLHPGTALAPVIHGEWFHDHVLIERRLFDGFVEPVDGALTPDLSRPGNGLSMLRDEAARFIVASC